MFAAREIRHSYGQTEVLRNISIEFRAGEITAVMGGNGAGKSTLLKILSGALRPTAGQVLLKSDSVAIRSIAQARHLRVWMSDQEGGLIPAWSVRDHFLILAGMADCAPWEALLPGVDGASLIADLHQEERQLIEIALACAGGSNVVLLDEPTAGQDHEAKDAIHAAMTRAAESNATVIWVTHDIRSALVIADRVIVLKAGHVSFDGQAEDATYERLLSHIVRDGEATFRSDDVVSSRASSAVSVAEVVSQKGVVAPIYQGEIVGIAGNARSRAREILRSACGLVNDSNLNFRMRSRLPLGEKFAYMSRERTTEWDFCGQSLAFCLAASSWPNLSIGGLIKGSAERHLAIQLRKRFDVVSASIDDPIESLSGGNRQKALLARMTATSPRVMLLDEPFSGVDAQARREIKVQLRNLASDMTIVVYTNEWDDLVGFADRVLSLREDGDIDQLQGLEISTASIELALITDSTGAASGCSA